MRRALLLTLSLIPLLARPGASEAQEIPSPYRYLERAQSVSLFGGYLQTGGGKFDTAPRSGPLLGARYTGRFAAPVAGEISFGVVPSGRTVYARTAGSTAEDPLTVVGEADALVLTGSAGLRLLLTGPRTWNGLAPSLGLSGGLVTRLGGRLEEEKSLPANQLVDSGPSFAVGLSAGTDWFLTERLSIRLQAEDQLWRLSIPEGLSGGEGDKSEWTHNLGVTLGAALHF